MRAAVVSRPGIVEIRQTARPAPGPGQTLIRLEGCGVCASNIPPWEGREWFKYPLNPGQLGHEGWGRIEMAGPDVSRFKPGDRVAFLSNHAYAEYDVADEGQTIALPSELDDQPFPAEPLGCAVNVFRRSGVRAEHDVAIIGAGFLGVLLTRLAADAGARVLAISRRPSSLELARSMGAAECIAMDDHARIIEQVKRLTGGRFCPVVIEAAGHQWPLDLGGELTAERGRLVIAGYHQDGPRQVNMQLWNWRGLDVINAHERDPAIYLQGMQSAARWVARRHIDLNRLFTHRFPLEGLADALNVTAQRPDGFIKALVLFEGDR
jgi:threonine dehydrogenase-like Zn-dependent dehydrogenase